MDESQLPGEDRTESALSSPVSPARAPRDQLSIWSLILIVLFFVLQGLTMAGWQPGQSRHKAISQPASVSRSALGSDNALEQLVSIDSQAKAVYVSQGLTSLLPGMAGTAPAGGVSATPAPGKTAAARQIDVNLGAGSNSRARPTAALSPVQAKAPTGLNSLGLGGAGTSLPDVIKLATDALRSSPRDIDFANRLILLRAEADMPPLAPIPPDKKKPGLSSPLAAFTPDPGMTARDAAMLQTEAGLWKTLFSTPALSQTQNIPSLTRTITSLPNLHWYGLLALHQLYLRASDKPRADAAHKNIVLKAAESIIPVGIIGLGFLVMLGVGAVLFVALVIGSILADRYRNAGPGPHQLSRTTVWLINLGWPRAPAVPDSERKLGAGDLMNVFVFYLVAGVVIGYVFDYLSGGPLHHWIQALSFKRSVDFLILAEFVAYVLNGALALWLLAAIARRRGTSFAAELGLTSRLLWQNMLFGLAGWGMGLALMLAIGSVAERATSRAPEPTNPAVMLMVDAPGLLSRILLYLLAAVAAPFFEELLFRGVFFNAARIRLGPWPAIVLTGLVFGFAHPVGVGQALILGTLGAVFAWMAYTRKSLAPSMTGHFLQNTYATSMMWLIFSVRLPWLG